MSLLPLLYVRKKRLLLVGRLLASLVLLGALFFVEEKLEMHEDKNFENTVSLIQEKHILKRNTYIYHSDREEVLVLVNGQLFQVYYEP